MATETHSVAPISNSKDYYKPLDPVKHDIRLLVLWPGQYWNRDEPKCCLVHTRLACEKPMYDALSYCWGDLNETKFIKMELTKDLSFCHDSISLFDQYAGQYQPDDVLTFIDNHMNQQERLRIWFDRLPDKGKFVTDFCVTTNLHNALKAHLLDEPRLLWVDAICIDQNNELERSHQVGYMREIYKRAINVTVWLGNDLSSGGDEILRDMDKLASFVKKFRDRLRSSRSGDATIDEMFKSQQISTFIRDYAKFVYKDEPITEALMECFQKCCEFFKNPWFRRIWVLQEIRVSQRKVVRCNRGHLWDTITVADQFVDLISKSPSNIFHLPRHTYHLDVWNWIVYQKDPTPILELIFGTREFGATNPRDKLVALFGIAAETAYLDSLPAELNSAYVKTKIDFFTDFTSWYINLKRSLTVLSAVCYSRPNDISKGPTLDKHPTWVPDYHERIPPAGMTIGFPVIYRASDDRPIHRYAFNDPRILRLEGVEIGRISRSIASEFCIGYLDPNVSNHVLAAKFDDGFEFGGKRGVLPVLPTLWQWLQRGGDNAPTVEAVFRTLTCCISTSVDAEDSLLMRLRSFISREDLWKEFVLHWSKFDPGHFPMPSTDKTADTFAELALVSCAHRSLFSIAGKVAINLGPEYVLPDDLVVILFGGTVPYVLRETGPPGMDPAERFSSNPVYEFIGECYVDEYMDGSYVRNADQGKIFDIL
jgi:hypothetical protein